MRFDLSLRDALLADIARRVRPTVPDMSQADFDQLVSRMADIELKFRDRAASTDWRQVTPAISLPVQRPA
jgi:hypothetical protein